MNSSPSPRSASKKKGSALLTVVMLTGIMALLTASMLTYTISERRGNERNRLILRAKNMAENMTIYAAEQLTTKLYRLGSAPLMYFPWTGTSRNRVFPPPDQVLDTAFTSHTNTEMRVGITARTDYALVNDTSSPNNGLQVSTATVPIIAKVTATHPALGNYTAYVEQDMALALTPLFQFGMFYNMDLELYPSQAFTLTGPVHTNNRLMAHPDGNQTIAITFTDRVTAAGGMYADSGIKVVPRGGTGVENPMVAADGDVIFTHTNGTTQVSLKDTDNLWRDHKYKTTTAETTTTLNLFKTFATNTYNGNLRTNVHGVTKLELPGIGTYKEQDDPSTPSDDERSNGRQIIEPPNAMKWIWNSTTHTGAWTANTDDPDAVQSKISWKAGLYLIVNPSEQIRSCTVPDGSTQYLQPHSYRTFLNTIDTAGVHTVTEVILPGQPTYGYNNGPDNTPGTADDYMYTNNLPNRYIDNGATAGNATYVGSNQILRIPLQDNSAVSPAPPAADASHPNAVPPALSGYNRTNNGGTTFPADSAATSALAPADAYFYDMRRANSNRGVIGISGTQALYDRFTVPYNPRPIAKIDFDMLRFKMMVDRLMSAATTSTGYDPRTGTAVTAATIPDWTHSIYNPAGVTVSRGLGLGVSFNVFPTASTMTAPDPFQLYYAPTTPTAVATINSIATDPRVFAVPATAMDDSSHPCAWYDGIAIYLHSVDAEIRHQTASVPDRRDSGVRLINGRGTIASLTTTGRTGCTFVTNDAVYIIGHYNADGTINTTTSAAGYGGYSSRYPDSASEKLCAVMGDAFTALSQPTWSGTTSGQVGGWNDALSALPCSASASGWRTGASTSSTLAGSFDGVYVTTGIKPSLLPNESTPGSLGTAMLTELGAVDTELSTALLVGIVPSNASPGYVASTGNAAVTDGFVPAWTHAATGDPLQVGNRTNAGGANNYPRLLESWQPGGVRKNLFIRGSMVALFESRVAMEPFTNSRCYQAPGRFWGLHENFRTAQHDVPLEPIVLGNNRMGFRSLTPTEYATEKAVIEALPAAP